MTRLEALKEVQEKLSGMEVYLQGGYLSKEKRRHEFDIAVDGKSEGDELAGCMVQAVDDLGSWITNEIANLEYEQAESMPFQGYEVGQ